MSKGESYRKLSEYRSQSREPVPRPARPAQSPQSVQSSGGSININAVVADADEILNKLGAIVANTLNELKMVEEALSKLRESIKVNREKLVGTLPEREAGIALRALVRFEITKLMERIASTLGGGGYVIGELRSEVSKIGLRGIINKGDENL